MTNTILTWFFAPIAGILGGGLALAFLYSTGWLDWFIRLLIIISRTGC